MESAFSMPKLFWLFLHDSWRFLQPFLRRLALSIGTKNDPCSTYDCPESELLTSNSSSKTMPKLFCLPAAKNWPHLLIGLTMEPCSLHEAPQILLAIHGTYTAQECRHFLLYYLPVTLSGISSKQVKYLIHVFLLMKAVRICILLGTSFTRNDLQTAHGLLDLYVMKFEGYYGLLSIECKLYTH